MAKVKNKRNSGLADKVHSKRKAEINKKKINPFEVHVNREKIKVLGKKSKHDKGLPGVSRAKAVQKRKETLGTEMKLMNKTNTFIDRRIGEKNNQLSAEDKMIARFAAERVKQHNKKSIYNLADDEILTHRGQTLEQIEKFDDPRSDDEDEEGKAYGGLDYDFVAEGHFGGGMLSKTDSKDGAKSHKDLIEQLIAESKKRKAEKQKDKEQTLDLTEKLDSEWKDLQPVVFKRPRVEEESAIDKVLNKAEKNSQDYDKMMRELKFEKRGMPSDALKSDEKQAKEEREKLEQWERERQQRMTGDDEVIPVRVKQPAPKHRSAEDLDDNFELEDEASFMLAYDKDGKPLVPEHILKDYSVPNAKPKFEDGVSDTSDEENSDDADDESNGDDDGDSDEQEVSDEDAPEETTDDEKHVNDTDNKGAAKEINDNRVEGKKLEVENLSSQSESEEDTEDELNVNIEEGTKVKEPQKVTTQIQINNVDTSEDSSNDIPESNDKQNVLKITEKNCISNNVSAKCNGNVINENNRKNVDDLNAFNDLKSSSDESDDSDVDDTEIGTMFEKSNEGESLKELLSGKTPSQQYTAIQKLIKTYDPSLGEENKDKLSRLFAHLLQHINDIFTNLKDEGSVIKAFLIFDRLIPHMFDLAKLNKISTKKYLVDLLVEKRNKYMKRPKRIPDLDTLIFFKLISLLYPTSDFRHPVTTPSLLFMSEILNRSRFDDAFSISRGFFVTALILEYTVLSKRLVPSALNYLRGILYYCANTSILNQVQLVPPFMLHKMEKILNLNTDCSKMSVANKMAAKDLILESVDDDFKIRCLLISTVMLKEFFDNFNELEAQECMFEYHIKLLARIDTELYPKKVASIVSEVSQYMKECLEMKTYTPLCREKKRPKALRLYEPDVQEVFTGSKGSKLSREQAEAARLKTKLKKEMKGALREIRRDKSYIASVKLKEKMRSDNIRKEKVKQIYKEAAIQQGELNKLKRSK